MRNYYHFCFTCPQCHEPYKDPFNNFAQLSFLENGNLLCSECKTEFHPYVDSINFFRHLYWNVTLNSIENDYIQWILQKSSGIFLITWPWSNVRFLPILLTEYCLSNENEKIVIIGDYEELDKEKKYINGYSLPEIIKKTIFINDPVPVPDHIKKMVGQLKNNRSLLFELKKVVSVKYRKYGSGDIHSWIYPHTLKKCINEVRRSALEDFGLSYLRTIIQKKRDGSEFPGYNNKDVTEKVVDPQNGIWDVTLTEQDQWSGKLNYNILWLGEVLANYEKIIPCKDVIKSECYFNSDRQTNDSSVNVHLISSRIDPNKIFSLVRKILPSLLIVENTDNLISDIRYNGPASRELIDYLNAPARTVLLFSTNPEHRQFYKLESEKNIFSPVPVTVQTVDSAHVLTHLTENCTQSKFPNPLSSMMVDVVERRTKKLFPQYIESEELTEFNKKISPVVSAVENEFARDIRFYLRRVISSPLNIIGDYSDFRYLTARRGVGQYITYDSVYSDLWEYADSGKIPKDIPELFRMTFHSQYISEESQNKNPLRSQFFRKAEDILERNPLAHITFVVNFSDIKGLERLIEADDSFNDVFKSRLMVSGWRDLRGKEEIIGKNNMHYVISSQYPSLYYSLRDSGIKEFIFICDHNGIEGIKEIIDHRLLETYSFPVVQPKENWEMPELLRVALKKAHVPATSRIAEVYLDIDEIFQFSDWKGEVKENREITGTIGNQVLSGISAGEEAILCIDRLDRAIFIPPAISVMVRKGDLFDDIHIDDKSPETKIEKELNNRDIILDKSGLFLSFRKIFFRFMMEHGKRMKFPKRPYEWTGYESLFNDSILWIRFIEKAIEDYAKKNPDDSKNAELMVSTKLVESGITAKEIGTVTGWFKHYEEITLNSGQYRLYRTEHPFRLDDLRKIFKVLSDFISSADLNNVDPERVYVASLCLQDFRRKVFQSSPDDDPSFFSIRSGFKRELSTILLDTEVFSPIFVKRVRVVKVVEPMKIIQNYRSYLVEK